MPTFIMLTRLSTDAVRSPRDLEELERVLAERIRTNCPTIKWHSSYALLGPYDYLDVFEAPTVEDAARVAALVRTFGHATTEVWSGTPWSRFKEVIRDLPGRPDWSVAHVS